MNNMSILKNECKHLKSEYLSIREEENYVYGSQTRWMTKHSLFNLQRHCNWNIANPLVKTPERGLKLSVVIAGALICYFYMQSTRTTCESGPCNVGIGDRCSTLLFAKGTKIGASAVPELSSRHDILLRLCPCHSALQEKYK